MTRPRRSYRPPGSSKKPSQNDNVVWWTLGSVVNVASYVWPIRAGGAFVAGAFVGWRTWNVFGLRTVFATMCETVATAAGVADQAIWRREMVHEMREPGELAHVAIIFGAAIAIVRKSYKAQVEASDAGSVSDSDEAIFARTQVPDSDDEPGARYLFAELSRRQCRSQQGTATLAGALATMPKEEDASPYTPRRRLNFDGQPAPPVEGLARSASEVDQFFAQLIEHEEAA